MIQWMKARAILVLSGIFVLGALSVSVHAQAPPRDTSKYEAWLTKEVRH
jgi:hypothetical protein